MIPLCKIWTWLITTTIQNTNWTIKVTYRSKEVKLIHLTIFFLYKVHSTIKIRVQVK